MSNIVDKALELSAIGIYLHAISIALVIAGSTLAFILEILYHVRKDVHYHNLAYIFMKFVAIAFAFGAASGTIVEFGLVQVWSGFLLIVGTYGLLPFYIELLAFMIEAGLIAVLVYGWRKFKSRYIHLILIGLIAFGSNLSGALIMVVNSWMNVPWGIGDLANKVYPWIPIYGPDTINENLFYEIKRLIADSSSPLTQVLSSEVLNDLVGKYGPLLEDPWVVFQSKYAWVSIAHQLIATILTGGSWYAFMLIFRYARGEKELFRPFIDIMLFLSVLLAIQGVIGHDMGVQVIEYQPTKFAMIAGLRESGPDPVAGLTTFGDPNYIFPGFDYFIKISMSVSSHYLFGVDSREIALNDVYKALEYLPLVFNLYTLKITLAVSAGLVALLFMYIWVRPMKYIENKRLLMVLTGYFMVSLTVVSALGWAVRELGRKPWTIYGLFYPEELISLVELNPVIIILIIGGLVTSLSIMVIVLYLHLWRRSTWT